MHICGTTSVERSPLTSARTPLRTVCCLHAEAKVPWSKIAAVPNTLFTCILWVRHCSPGNLNLLEKSLGQHLTNNAQCDICNRQCPLLAGPKRKD